MVFTITTKDLQPLCSDFEFVVNDIDELADRIVKLMMGWCVHVSMIVRSLAEGYPEPDVDVDTITALIETLDKSGKSNTVKSHIDGWIFQMISWLVLAEQHKDYLTFNQCPPHPQPAMHGIDGIAILLKEDSTIERIIITEDKCTTSPRNKIQQQVFPEFEKFESGKKNTAIMNSVAGMLLNTKIFVKIQNDITKKDYRQYRIVITRTDAYDSDAGRKALFANYDEIVKGDVRRRTCSTANFIDTRAWIEDLRLRITSKLNALLPK